MKARHKKPAAPERPQQSDTRTALLVAVVSAVVTGLFNLAAVVLGHR